MFTQGSVFAKYSKPLCWIVSGIWLLLSIVAFTGDAGNSTISGFLWLAGACAFAISAFFQSRHPHRSEHSGD
jgi:hypothetical protein